METKGSFATLDLGLSTQPTSVPIELVEVEISTDNLFTDYGKAFVNEAYRVNPLKAEQVALTEEEMVAYVNFLVYQRIKCVHMDCPEFRKLKALYVPSYVQYVISLIGEVNLRQKGLRFMPVMEDDGIIGLEEAYRISDKIGSFETELQMVQDAMPRSIQGDINIMSLAMIADRIRGMTDEKVHPSYTYACRFLGMKLREEVNFTVLYRTEYDDTAAIAMALTRHKGIF